MIEISWQFPAAEVERVDEGLLEVGDERWMVLQDVIAGAAKVVGVFGSQKEAEEAWEALKAAGVVQEGDSEAVFRSMPEAEWRDSYKVHFHAWRFGSLHWVPVWERETFQLPPGDSVLWLDPGMAFGTGNHETTRLCVERLVNRAERYGVVGSVIDVGCGSGILALSAVKLGFAEVEGFDNDPEAVRVSEENAALNQLASVVHFYCANVASGL